MANLQNLTITSDGFIKLPVGTGVERPAAGNGKIRFNQSRNELESYNSNQWQNTANVVRNIRNSNLTVFLDPNNPQSYSGTGNTWFDLSGNGNNFTLENTSYQPVSGGVFEFNGSSSRATSSFSVPTSSHTLLMWIKPNQPLSTGTSSGNRKVFVKTNDDWTPGIWQTRDRFRVHAANEYRDLEIDWGTDTEWHFVGQTYDGNTVRAVIDGEILLPIDRSSYTPGGGSSLVIGNEEFSGSSQYGWDGQIGAFLLYDTVLTDQEIFDIYKATKNSYRNNSLGEIKLAERFGNGDLTYKFQDTKYLDNTGSIVDRVSSPYIATPEYSGQATMYNDGASGVWETVASTLEEGTGATIVWWQKFVNPSSNQRPFDTYPAVNLFINRANDYSYRTRSRTWNFRTYTLDDNFDMKDWHFFALVLSGGRVTGTQTDRWYVGNNGRLYETDKASTSYGSGGNVCGFMGYDNGSNSYDFRGYFGEFRTYKKVLTYEEIAKLYNKGIGRIPDNI